MRASALIPILFILAAAAAGCRSGATEAECKAAYAKTMVSLAGDRDDVPADKKKSYDELETKYVSGCMASRKKGFGDCVVSAPDAPGRMDCTVRFTK